MPAVPPKSAPPEAPADGRNERELLHFLLENIPDRIYFKDRESRFIRISRALAKLFHLDSPALAVGKTDFDFFTREHAEPAFQDEQQVMRTGQPIIGKVEKETLPDGQVRWAITTKMPLRNSDGEVVGTCGVSKDFTAQKALEEAVEHSNRELTRRHEQLQKALLELNQALENLKATQQQLIEAEKMQTAGRLAYGVAHEVRNPLNILHAGLDFLANEPAVCEDPANAAILEEMHHAIRRADAVICALMDSSSGGNLNLSSWDIHAVIDSAIDSLETEWERCGIALVKRFDTSIPDIQVDRGKLEQCFAGVLKNASDVLPDGGRVLVRTSRRQLTDSDAEHDPGLRTGHQLRVGEEVVAIEIEDNGPGIARDALDKVFDPFFTTKETGSGTGLGLTVCRKIIELHGGSMRLENREEGGVRATILLKIGSL